MLSVRYHLHCAIYRVILLEFLIPPATMVPLNLQTTSPKLYKLANKEHIEALIIWCRNMETHRK